MLLPALSRICRSHQPAWRLSEDPIPINVMEIYVTEIRSSPKFVTYGFRLAEDPAVSLLKFSLGLGFLQRYVRDPFG